MKTRSEGDEDPVVAEVRRIRAELWRESGGTVAGLLRLLETRQGPKRRAPARKRGRSVPHPHPGNAPRP
ncbi:MAG: hypothetical protein L0338_25465 [Acidobacteria bacterium]|nr:hypothetical protein [Acidobacteriota bacterium]